MARRHTARRCYSNFETDGCRTPGHKTPKPEPSIAGGRASEIEAQRKSGEIGDGVGLLLQFLDHVVGLLQSLDDVVDLLLLLLILPDPGLFLLPPSIILFGPFLFFLFFPPFLLRLRRRRLLSAIIFFFLRLRIYSLPTRRLIRRNRLLFWNPCLLVLRLFLPLRLVSSRLLSGLLNCTHF